MSGAETALAPVPDAWPYWDGTPLPPSDRLRWGFTTGACACGCLAASWLALRGRTDQRGVALRFGDGVTRTLPLGPELADWPGWMVIRKNAGDDPDCTHGLLVAGRVSPWPEDAPADERDLVITVADARVRIHCVTGVGLAGRAGLDCQRGRWAVNPGVTAMLADNLLALGLREGAWTAAIAIPGGEALAARTLNASLGVTGGLSLLGTTGLVRPFSHEAYMATVRVCLRAAASEGDTCVLCTGRRTLRAARDWFAAPGHGGGRGPLPESAFVSMADFAGESLRAAAGLGLRHVVVCCMPGKLLKYAAGRDNTHAHREAQDMDLLGDVCAALFPDNPGLAGEARACPGMRAAMELFSPAQTDMVLERLAGRALEQFLRLCRRPATTGRNTMPSFALLLADFAGRAVRRYADETQDDPGQTC